MDHNMGKSLIDFNTSIFFYSTSSFFWPLFFTAYQLKSMCARASIHGAVDGSRHSNVRGDGSKEGEEREKIRDYVCVCARPCVKSLHTHTLYVYL